MIETQAVLTITTQWRLRWRRVAIIATAWALLGGAVGCANSKWVTVRSTPRNPLASTLQLLSKRGPKATGRTSQLLRRYALTGEMRGDRTELIAKLTDLNRDEPNRENEYAIAELAYVGAKRIEKTDRQQAVELFGSALLHSYRYLFEDTYGVASNPYDPQFRAACDLYNAALEDLLRIVQQDSQIPLRPGAELELQTDSRNCRLAVELHSQGWHVGDFDRFEFVSDFAVRGLTNHHRSYGLGVPLIAIRQQHSDESAAEKYYPQRLCYPVTAFLRVDQDRFPMTDRANDNGAAAHTVSYQGAADSEKSDGLRLVLELHDPLDREKIVVGPARVPLESDLSTPLAYMLNQPEFDENRLSTLGLFMPEKVQQLAGLYMLEPFQPGKVPVVLVHGLWSTPVTWMEMFNDLRSDPLIRRNYQFWFYFYPTGQPFWLSAATMREDLATMRRDLDPTQHLAALDQTVLVGHSMGGLVSKLQTIDSGNGFWSTVSAQPFADLQAQDDLRSSLSRTFFFQPNPSISRVVTIGTPHRGSDFANDATKWLGRKLISVPARILRGRRELLAANPDYFRRDAPLDVSTSIDSLSPDSPLLPVLLAAQPGPWVKYHNIVGRIRPQGFARLISGEGDGVVSYESARLDNLASEQVRSQLIVTAEHSTVHRHPAAIREVRQILVQHIADLRSFPREAIPVATAGGAAVTDGAVAR